MEILLLAASALPTGAGACASAEPASTNRIIPRVVFIIFTLQGRLAGPVFKSGLQLICRQISKGRGFYTIAVMGVKSAPVAGRAATSGHAATVAPVV